MPTPPENQVEPVPVGKPEDNGDNKKVEEVDAFTKKEMKKKKLGAADKIDICLEKTCRFTIMDIIEDHCRVRAINVWAFLLVYVFFVLAMFHLAPTIKPVLKDVEFISMPPSTITAGKGKKNVVRTAKALVLKDTGAPEPSGTVVPSIVEVRPALEYLPCGTYDRYEIAHTLEAFRSEEVCRTSIAGNGSTSNMGLGTVQGFDIDGPAGMYTVALSAETEVKGTKHKQASKSAYKSSLRTAVQSLDVRHPRNLNRSLSAPYYTTVGQELQVQPVVLVRDAQLNPLSGIEVVVFANPDPVWPPQSLGAQVPNYDRRGQKLAELECDRSEPSDSDGYARFTCLKVISSTWEKVNFVFTVNSMIFYPWNDPAFSYFNMYPFPLMQNRPSTWVFGDVGRIVVERGPPEEITEGTPLPEMRLQLKGPSGQPVSGVQCFALIGAENGGTLPLMFRRQLSGIRRKELRFPKSLPSNSDGIAVFPNVTISGYGNTIKQTSVLRESSDSSIGLRFACDGTLSNDMHTIKIVKSKVAEIRIKRYLNKQGYVTTLGAPTAADGSDLFMAVIRVVDSAGKGVYGKSVSVRPSKPPGEADVAVYLLGSASESTKASGFTVVTWRVVFGGEGLLKQMTQTYTVNFQVDGVKVQSEPLTMMARGPLNPMICSTVIFTSITSHEIGTGTTTTWDIMADRPKFVSGSLISADIQFLSQSTDLKYDPDPANLQSGGRRLTEEEVEHIEHGKREFVRRLQEHIDNGTAHELKRHSRRLVSKTNTLGTLSLSLNQAYSTEGKEETVDDGVALLVKHEPDSMTMGAIVDHPIISAPTLTEISTNPDSAVQVAANIQGQTGVHFVQIEATISQPGMATQKCLSPILEVEMTNVVEEVYLDTDPPFDPVAAQATHPKFTTTEALAGFKVKISFAFTEAFGVPEDGSLFLSEDMAAEGAVYFEWQQVPLQLQGKPDYLYNAYNTPLFDMTTVSAFKKIQNADGSQSGEIVFEIKFKHAGVFGFWSIMMGVAGTFSSPTTFQILEPKLEMEVLQAPVYNGIPIKTQTVLPDPFFVRVTSDGAPVEGAMVFAKWVAQDDVSTFTKIIEWDMVDMFDFLYSTPSGFCDLFNNTWASGNCEDTKWWYTGATLSDWSGVATFPTLMVLDGLGKGKIQFMLSWTTLADTLYPVGDPFEFVPAATYKIFQEPPPSMPLGMQMQDLATDQASKFIVHMSFPFGESDLMAYIGAGLARIAVGTYLDDPQTQLMSHAVTRELFTNMECLWIGGTEILRRCSKLEKVAGPEPTYSFEVKQMTWKLVSALPTKLNLVASDLSLTALMGSNMLQMPAGMAQMPSEQQNEICMEAAMASLVPVKVSRPMVPELTAVTGNLVIAPPAVVEVGSMFLTRLKATTASGGPVRGQFIRVALSATASLNPDLSGGGFLQQLGNMGNTLSAVALPDFELDAASVVQRTGRDGVASFPLSILKAKTGNYQLKFQVEETSATILFTSPAFQVVNPISHIVPPPDTAWDYVEIEDFENNVTIPKQLQFEVSISGNRSLQDLVDNGYQINIRLDLKGINPKVLEKIEKMKKFAEDNAKKAAKVAVDETKGAVKAAGSVVAGAVEAQLNSGKNPFARMSESLKEQCLKMPMATMGAAFNETLVREPELADAVKEDSSIIDPTEQLSQFIRTMTGGGAKMATGASMRLQLEMEIKLEDVKFISSSVDSSSNKFIGVYEVTTHIPFKFVEDGQYAWEVTINGVKSKKDAFKRFTARKIEPSPPEKAFKWVFTAIAGIVGVACLTSNTTKHHWLWILIAIPVTIVLIAVTPSMKGSKEALRDNWPLIAIINCALLLVCLLWALGIEILKSRKSLEGMHKKVKSPLPFGERREIYFGMYARRRLILAIGKKCSNDPDQPLEIHSSKMKLVPFIKEMVKPFNPIHAFYFPSQVWVGFLLSLFSYCYILIKAIQILGSIEDSLNALLDKTIVATLRLISRIEDQYRIVSLGQDLPDAATSFMHNQLELVRGWFESLVNVIEIGFTIGVILGGIVTLVGLFSTFIVYRKYALQLRAGVCPWGKRSDGSVVYDSMFMGQFIATTIVGFIMIVAVCVLVALPFGFNIIWEIIWSMRHYILFTLLIPLVVNKVSIIIAKKIMFAPFTVKHRAAASIYMFWQLWLSILGGISSAITRFVMGILGIILGLPTLIVPVTPEPLNKLCLLDSPHKTFLAAIMMFHCHNHPVVIYAKQCFVHMLQVRKEARKAGEVSEEVLRANARKRSKRFVVLLLIKHPWLAKHRKAYLHAERRKAFELAEAKKKKKGEGAEVVVQERKKPSTEEQQVLKAILSYRIQIEQNKFEIESLENGLSDVRRMPEGPARKQAVEKLLATTTTSTAC